MNESINEEWISDKARFSFDGLSSQRLLSPLLKDSNGNFEPIDWSKATSIVLDKMSNAKPNKIGFSVGDFCDLDTLSSIHFLRSILNGVTINHLNEDYLDTDSSTSFKFNTCLSNLAKTDTCLLIGIDPKIDGVLLNYHLRKKFLSGNFKLAYIGSHLNLTFPSVHLGNSFDTFLSILEGKNTFCKSLRQSKKPTVIIGKSFLKYLSAYNLNIFLNILKSNINVVSSSWAGLNFFNLRSSDFGFNDVGLNKNRGYIPSSLDLLYIVEDSRTLPKIFKSKFIIFQGHHGCLNAQIADLILPSTSFVEKTSLYGNCEGRYQLNLVQFLISNRISTVLLSMVLLFMVVGLLCPNLIGLRCPYLLGLPCPKFATIPGH